MSERKYKIIENTTIPKCPKCGNNTEFVCKSEQVAEDCCEIWVECKCGLAPSDDYHYEDVWGGVGKDEFYCGLGVWKDWILEMAEEVTASRPHSTRTVTLFNNIS